MNDDYDQWIADTKARHREMKELRAELRWVKGERDNARSHVKELREANEDLAKALTAMCNKYQDLRDELARTQEADE